MSRAARDYRQASKATYLRWKKSHPDVHLDYLQYQLIIYGFNYAFRDYLLETGERAKLPWGVGDFAIAKKKPRKHKISPKTGKEIIALPINWQKTNQLGYIVYHLNRHTEGFKFRVKWFISTAKYKLPDIWTFKPNRITSRLINHYILKDPKNQHKYQEWYLVE